ncbi:MAG TPA: DMT family transporter [Bacteroidales bacterium]|nr:DMT family transporter [Bacteroidales bacterium]
MIKYLNNLNPTVKGVGLAFLATIGMANVYVFSKAALLEVNFFQFQFYWFTFALIYNSIYISSTGLFRKIPQLEFKSKLNLLIIGTLELSAALTLFLAIQLAENPAVISFLSNATPIFATLLGIRFLGERFNMIEAMGILLTIGGVIMITYTRNMTVAQFFSQGSGWILLSSLLLSTSIVYAKKHIKKLHPGILAINRVIFLFLFGLIAVIIRQESLAVPKSAIFNMVAGSFLGPFLTGLAQYSALKFIEASRTLIIQATRGLFVMIGAMIYLAIMPTSMQIIGGIVTIVGVIIITTGKRKKRPPVQTASLNNSNAQSIST